MSAPSTTYNACVTKEVRKSLLTSFGEHHLDDDDDTTCPDTDLCCSIISELHESNSKLLRSTVQFRIAGQIMTPSVGCLTMYGVPILTSDACNNITRIGSGDEIIDIKAEFEDDEHRVHQDGCVKVQFWRSKFPSIDRKPNVYLPISRERPLLYIPDWDELGVAGPEFNSDRERIMKIVSTCYNMHELMPKGTSLQIELIYDKNAYVEAHESGKVLGKGKRARDANSAVGAHKRGRKSDIQHANSRRQSEAKHIGYCLYFCNATTSLPEITCSFAEHHLRPAIGPAFKSWLVLSQEIRQRTSSSGASAIERRPEQFCVILRRSSITDETIRPYTIAGAHGLVACIRALEKGADHHNLRSGDKVEQSVATESTTAGIKS
jgi:hypothetical protein